jgi:carboxypeptidase PM20D1
LGRRRHEKSLLYPEKFFDIPRTGLIIAGTIADICMQEDEIMIKKIALGAGAVLAVLVAVVVIRAATAGSKQVKLGPVPVVKLDEAKLAGNLSRALRYRTVSYQDRAKIDGEQFLAFHRYLAETFPRVHGTLKRETVNKLSLLYTWKGSDPSLKPLLLMAHMDVVPVEHGTEAKWTHPGFSGKIAGGFVWGRGALDMKNTLMGIFEAAEYLIGQGYKPKRTVYLAFGHDEEIGGEEGAKRIAALLESRKVRLEYSLDEGGALTVGILAGIERPVALVGTAEKGYLTLELSAEGEGGHSSMPPEETAAAVVCAAVERLQQNKFPNKVEGVARQMFEYLGPEMSFGKRLIMANLWLFDGLLGSMLSKSPATAAMLHTTLAPTMLTGSMKENQLPSRAVAVVNFRLLPGDSVASVIDHVTKAVDDPRVKVTAIGDQTEPSPVSNADSWGFATVQKTIIQVFPDALVAPYLVLGATDTKHYMGVTDSGFRFLPAPMKSEDLKRLHGINERIGTADYANQVRFYIQLVRNSNL